MKKIILSLLVISGICIMGASKPAEAQVILTSNQCCDANNVVRCIQINFTPVGSACYCNYQGWGRTC